MDGDSNEESPKVGALLVYCDGGSRGNPGPAAIGAVVLDATVEPPERIATVSECIGIATNNEAEYGALIGALEVAEPLGAKMLTVRADSELLVRQLEGRYRVKSPKLKPLYERARTLLARYDEVHLEHVRRELNMDADALVNAALDAVDG